MKSFSKVLVFLLFAALPFSLLGQNATVIASFMKVTPGHTSDYLEVEQAWKKIHQKAVNEGLYTSWQLYRKLHTGTNDPYDYITVTWYESYEASYNVNITPEWAEEVYSLDEQAEFIEKTMATRENVNEEVYHMAVSVDNPQPIKYLVVVRNHIPPDRRTEYFKMEREIFKPYQEEVIRRGALAQWGIWTAWPYTEGQAEVVITEGFMDAKQLTNPDIDSDDVLATVHPDLNWEDLVKEIMKNRKQISVEVWELLDYVTLEEQ